jgi:hypothetical protein
MPDARYLRAQAQHYLDLAQQNSQGWEALTLKRMAAECLSDAEKIESGEAFESSDPFPSFARMTPATNASALS